MSTPFDEAQAGRASSPAGLQPYHEFIVDLISPGSRVLDLGCGNGELLTVLMRRKGIRAEGIELSPQAVQEAVARGVPSVHQADLDEGLGEYGDQSMDTVILTNTIQVLHRPLDLLQEMARVGRQCVVSFPNFAHWRVRWGLLVRGRMPQTPQLPYEWYDTPNIHLTTLLDFREFCEIARLQIVKELALRTKNGLCQRISYLPNWRADQAVYLLRRKS